MPIDTSVHNTYAQAIVQVQWYICYRHGEIYCEGGCVGLQKEEMFSEILFSFIHISVNLWGASGIPWYCLHIVRRKAKICERFSMCVKVVGPWEMFLFWTIMRPVVVIPYRRFGTTYRSHLQGTMFLLGFVPWSILAPWKWDR
jgi:hypothetical protein